MRRFSLSTDRLTIRMLSRHDVTAFTRYRNVAAVARFQDWPLPYTRDHAHALVEALDPLPGPTDGGWVQLAIDAGDGLVGDVAVWLDDDGTSAMIGYTLSPEHQGKGYAVESVTAVVDWLFRRKRVHRIAATLDPRNLASARVLERCGFEYDGTARSAAFTHGEWTDDARFSILADDWRAWSSRPTQSPEAVELVPVTADNVRAVSRLRVAFSQTSLVAPVLVSLAEAYAPPMIDGERLRPWVRAITADGDLAGFMMFAEPHPGHPHPYLWRMMVDHRHQRRGIGRRALLDALAQRRSEGHTHVTVSWVPDVEGSPEPFYRSLGFQPTGEIHDGEVVARVELG